MKRFALLLAIPLVLSACIDTTGLSGDLVSPPHPKSNPNGIVTVAEYGDLQCPACRAAHEQLLEPLMAKYGSVIRFDFHHFPLTAMHQFAMDAAEAAECAADQGKFWEFMDINYANQEKLNRTVIDSWAQDLGIDMELFGRCRESHIKRAAIKASYESAKELGVNSTPTFFVNGKKPESNTLEGIGAAIDSAVQTAGSLL